MLLGVVEECKMRRRLVLVSAAHGLGVDRPAAGTGRAAATLY